VKLTPLALTLGAILAATPALAAPAYAPAGAVALGAPDRWDYVVVDHDTGRVYVAHGDKLAVLDGRVGKLVGQVEGIAGGTHGTGISAATGQGFTDDGKNGLAVVFDLQTLKVVKQIHADADADAIARDPVTGDIFVIEGDPGAVTVISPKTGEAVGVIKAGEKLEYGAGDGTGFVYVAGEEKRDLIKIDARTREIVGRWSTPDCASPHGVAVDAASRRVFMGCINSVMMVLDADTGAIVAKLPIGRGSDAVAWDAKRKRAFSSNGADGTITVYQQTSPDSYEALDPIPTAVSGRTMDVDPETGRLFVAAADADPPAQPGGRPRPRPGTLKVLMFDPVK
jgi:DNA-binding beta-propeller fold protein YncE